LAMALLDFALPRQPGQHPNWTILGLLATFATADLLARFPGIGPMLRDSGVPFLTLLSLLLSGGALLFQGRTQAVRTKNKMLTKVP